MSCRLRRVRPPVPDIPLFGHATPSDPVWPDLGGGHDGLDRERCPKPAHLLERLQQGQGRHPDRVADEDDLPPLEAAQRRLIHAHRSFELRSGESLGLLQVPSAPDQGSVASDELLYFRGSEVARCGSSRGSPEAQSKLCGLLVQGSVTVF